MYQLKNRIQLIGNVGNSPEVTVLENNKKLVRFSMATNESYRNSIGEKVVETQWHNLVAWNKIADIVEKYLPKGAQVAIEGRLVHRSYIDKDGNKRYISEIQVSELLLLNNTKPASTTNEPVVEEQPVKTKRTRKPAETAA